MYGPHRDLVEVLDQLAEVREAYPDSRIHVTRVDPTGVPFTVGMFAPTQIDLDALVKNYGGGEYRLRVQQPGQPKAAAMLRFLAASPMQQQAAPAPVPQQLPPAPQAYYVQPQAAAPLDMGGSMQAMFLAMMQMAQRNAEQQANMTNTLLAKLIDQRTTPQEPAKISELEAMMKLADKLSSRRGRGGDDDSDAGDGLVSEVIRGLAAAMQNNKNNATPAPTPARPPVVRPVRRVTTQASGAAPARLAAAPEPRSAAPESSAPIPPEAPAPTPGASAPAQHTEAAPEAAQLSPGLALIAAHLKADPDARRLAKMILVEDQGDAEDPAAIAEWAAGAMDDDKADAFLAAEPGSWAACFVAAFPQLDARRDLVAAVEAELRAVLIDAGPEGDDDQGDGEDTDDTKENDDA